VLQSRPATATVVPASLDSRKNFHDSSVHSSLQQKRQDTCKDFLDIVRVDCIWNRFLRFAPAPDFASTSARYNTSAMSAALGPTWALGIYICFFFGGALGFWIVRARLVAQANRELPEGAKVQRTMWPRTGLKSGEITRMWRAHREFFPNSSLRFLYIALWVLTLSWMFIGLELLQG
jgi:hypothetical protein